MNRYGFTDSGARAFSNSCASDDDVSWERSAWENEWQFKWLYYPLLLAVAKPIHGTWKHYLMRISAFHPSWWHWKTVYVISVSRKDSFCDDVCMEAGWIKRLQQQILSLSLKLIVLTLTLKRRNSKGKDIKTKLREDILASEQWRDTQWKKNFQTFGLVTMTTTVEQTTNDLLHFSGRFQPSKPKSSHVANPKKKPFVRISSRAALWNIKCSGFAMKTHNPIRAIVDGLKIEPNKEKPMIALSIGELISWRIFWILVIKVSWNRTFRPLQIQSN